MLLQPSFKVKPISVFFIVLLVLTTCIQLEGSYFSNKKVSDAMRVIIANSTETIYNGMLHNLCSVKWTHLNMI